MAELPVTFRAFRVAVEEGEVYRGVQQVSLDDLPAQGEAGHVTVAVEYSALNYKDALSASGNRGVSKSYPHTPGIDAAGKVAASSDDRYEPGDEVLITGYDLGMNTPGGWAQYVRVPADWLVPMPRGLNARSAMVLGTAGFTAAIALGRLESAGVSPAAGPLVVTGASGGVGTISVALLAAAGYEVVAASGKPSAAGLLERLGADTVVGREEFGTAVERPMLTAEFGGGIDTVGGVTLANLIKRTVPDGAVAACGLVGGTELHTSVFPFILRGVALLGVDSVNVPADERLAHWRTLSALWQSARLEDVAGLVDEVGLDDLEAQLEAILQGALSGRVVVRIAD